jgi:hypothetical protein
MTTKGVDVDANRPIEQSILPDPHPHSPSPPAYENKYRESICKPTYPMERVGLSAAIVPTQLLNGRGRADADDAR